jgi:hypothetical protein
MMGSMIFVVNSHRGPELLAPARRDLPTHAPRRIQVAEPANFNTDGGREPRQAAVADAFSQGWMGILYAD